MGRENSKNLSKTKLMLFKILILDPKENFKFSFNLKRCLQRLIEFKLTHQVIVKH